jgi:hypothetical protein
MRAFLVLCIGVMTYLTGCTTAPGPGPQAEPPERIRECGAMGNRGLGIFELCGQLGPQGKKTATIHTSECGRIKVNRTERNFLCQGTDEMYRSLPQAHRAELLRRLEGING